MSLIARLCLLVLLAMLPALAIQLHHELELRRDGEQRLRDEALRAGLAAAGEMDRILESARVLLVALAEQTSVRGLDAQACSTYVARLNVNFPGLRDIAAFDLAGRPFCASAPLPPGVTVADRSYFQAALKDDRPVVGELIVSRASGGRNLPMAVSFDDLSGRRAGVVALGIAVEWLGEYFRSKAWPPGGSISIIDRGGTILVRWPNLELVGTRLSEPFRWMLQAPQPGTTKGVGPDGVTRVGGYVPPAVANGLLVSVGLSRERALAELDAVLRRDLVLIIVGLALALLAAVSCGHWFIRRPVGQLLAATERWARGETGVRVGLRDRQSEIGRLGQAFDRMAVAVEEREAALRTSEEHFRLLADTVPDIVWTAAPDGTITYANQRWYDYCGISREANERGWPELVLHPDDRERCLEAWSRSLREGRPYEIEVRNRRHDGEYRWFLTRAVPVRNADGRIVAWFGATTDIDDRKRAEAERELLVRELGHRIRNMFALIRSIFAQSVRHSASLDELAPAFLGRLDMLARLSAVTGTDERATVALRTVAEAALEPYRAKSNLKLAGTELELPAPVARTLSLCLHELATNAAKYGALSREGGAVDLRWTACNSETEPRLVLDWQERGGPEVRPSGRRGFGRTLIEQSLQALGGTARLELTPSGLSWRLEAPLRPH